MAIIAGVSNQKVTCIISRCHGNEHNGYEFAPHNYSYINVVGNHDGTYKGKRYFTCPDSHGVIVPIHEVHVLVPADVRTLTITSLKIIVMTAIMM